jgi:hypothetical protein
MIMTSNRGFAEWGDVFGDPVTAQTEGASYRLRGHSDLFPERARTASSAKAPRPSTKNGAASH